MNKQQLHGKGKHKRSFSLIPLLQRAVTPTLLLLAAGFFWQSEDETGMYIILAVVVVAVGLVNLLKGFFIKRKRTGGHGHNGETTPQGGDKEGAE